MELGYEEVYRSVSSCIHLDKSWFEQEPQKICEGSLTKEKLWKTEDWTRSCCSLRRWKPRRCLDSNSEVSKGIYKTLLVNSVVWIRSYRNYSMGNWRDDFAVKRTHCFLQGIRVQLSVLTLGSSKLTVIPVPWDPISSGLRRYLCNACDARKLTQTFIHVHKWK